MSFAIEIGASCGHLCERIFAEKLAERSDMIWRIRTFRGGTWTEDAMPYVTVESALEVLKRAIAAKKCDSAYLESSDGKRVEWEEIKQQLGIN
jgi:hypothetical protein